MMSLEEHEEVADARWISEPLRLYRRYEREIVAAFGLCPWAGDTRRDGRIAERVLVQRDGEVNPSLAAIETLGDDVDLALLLYPRLGMDRAAFERFGSSVRDAEVARRPLGSAPFVFAVFHPDAVPDVGDPERLIPYLRRTPDPTLQLVRATTLDRVRSVASQGTTFIDLRSHNAFAAERVPLRRRVASANLETVRRRGLETLEAAFEDIRRDRESTYRSLLAGKVANT